MRRSGREIGASNRRPEGTLGRADREIGAAGQDGGADTGWGGQTEKSVRRTGGRRGHSGGPDRGIGAPPRGGWASTDAHLRGRRKSSILGGMRVKTSVTIDEKVLQALDRAARGRSRSRILEDAARDYLVRQAQEQREASDRRVLDEVADDLNREMEDVLSYQIDV